MAIRKRYITPRQKMINLLYIILMAMLAINVSSDVMKGYGVMTKALDKSTGHSLAENRQVFSEIEQLYRNNPVKTARFMELSRKVRDMADSISAKADSARACMVSRADGTEMDGTDIIHVEDTEVPYYVMIREGRTDDMEEKIHRFRSLVLSVMPEGRRKAKVADCLDNGGTEWWRETFRNLPLAGAVTLLAKIQNDVRYAEGEALHALLESVDTRDIRANRLEAFIVPETRRVVQGDRFRARVMLAAVDTTQMPEILVGPERRRIEGDILEFNAASPGEHTLTGTITVRDRFGETKTMPFRETYTVMEPMSNVTSALMNVLYAGYDNPVNVDASGIDPSDLDIVADGCKVTRKGGARFVVKPGASLAGKDAQLKVRGKTVSGKMMEFLHTFHVRTLPEPLPFLHTPAGKMKGGRVSKGTVLGTENIRASVDDGIINVPFQVTAFDMVFFDNLGNAKVFPSKGDRMTEEQKRMVERARKNARCYITSIRAKGPDGITKKLNSSMEIIFR